MAISNTEKTWHNAIARTVNHISMYIVFYRLRYVNSIYTKKTTKSADHLKKTLIINTFVTRSNVIIQH